MLQERKVEFVPVDMYGGMRARPLQNPYTVFVRNTRGCAKVLNVIAWLQFEHEKNRRMPADVRVVRLPKSCAGCALGYFPGAGAWPMWCWVNQRMMPPASVDIGRCRAGFCQLAEDAGSALVVDRCPAAERIADCRGAPACAPG